MLADEESSGEPGSELCTVLLTKGASSKRICVDLESAADGMVED